MLECMRAEKCTRRYRRLKKMSARRKKKDILFLQSTVKVFYLEGNCLFSKRCNVLIPSPPSWEIVIALHTLIQPVSSKILLYTSSILRQIHFERNSPAGWIMFSGSICSSQSVSCFSDVMGGGWSSNKKGQIPTHQPSRQDYIIDTSEVDICTKHGIWHSS